VYDAIGHDLLRLGDAIRALVAVPYGTNDCVAPGNMERQHWNSLHPDQLTSRIGWGSFLVHSAGTAERILLLQQLLVAYAYKVGNLDHGFGGLMPEPAGLVDGLSLRNRQAVCWKAARTNSLLRAVALTLRVARVGRQARRQFPQVNSKRLTRTVCSALSFVSVKEEALCRYARPITRFCMTGMDLVLAPRDVFVAWLNSSEVIDVRRLDHPPNVREDLGRRFSLHLKEHSYWSTRYDIAMEDKNKPDDSISVKPSS